jgi:plastocyanin
MDTGVLHNIEFLKPDGTSLGATAVMMGPVQQSLALGALAAGTYSFKCEVHPQQMNGSLVVS